MSWFNDLPQGARVLIMIVVGLIGASVLISGGYTIGKAIGQAIN